MRTVALTICLLLGFATSALAVDLKPCGPPEREAEVHCGKVEVLENRSKPNGRRIALNVVVVKALEPRPGAAPLVHLEGGPGVPATLARRFYLDAGREYRRTRDVLLLDQRGTGESYPLQCPALSGRSPLQEMYPLDLVRQCLAELEKKADLSQYGSAQAAKDLDEVRALLGYGSLDIWGLSYGTVLAQVYMKMFPGRVRSAVFFGTTHLDFKVPLQHAVTAQRALDLVLFDCQSDPACNAAYPNLRRDWERLQRRLAAGPVPVVQVDPGTGKETAAELERGIFGEALRSSVPAGTALRRLPYFIQRAAAGDFAPFLDSLPPDSSAFAEGLYLSIACPEGTARIREEEISRYTAGTFIGDYRVRQQVEACREWKLPSPPADFFQLFTGATPVLVISGDVDNVSPHFWAEEVCSGMGNCRLLIVRHMGHVSFDLGSWTNGQCVDDIVLRFYAAAEPAQLDVSCLKELRPPPFYVPEPAVALSAKEVAAFTGAYEGEEALRLVVDLLRERPRVRLFVREQQVGSSWITHIAKGRFRLENVPGHFLHFRRERGTVVGVDLEESGEPPRTFQRKE